ncbi:hypothetical protein AID08_20230 [Salmonella enterica subsp. enterica serovar Minnesota]|nr:hypothetical protein [Salmonella enterica subsp. enterica serovar Minnesota]
MFRTAGKDPPGPGGFIPVEKESKDSSVTDAAHCIKQKRRTYPDEDSPALTECGSSQDITGGVYW